MARKFWFTLGVVDQRAAAATPLIRVNGSPAVKGAPTTKKVNQNGTRKGGTQRAFAASN